MDTPGHYAITREATKLLFEKQGQGGNILGMNEAQFFQTLYLWTHYPDRTPVDALHPELWPVPAMGIHSPFNPLPGLGPALDMVGDTWHPGFISPDVQKDHCVADPNKTAKENLGDFKNFLLGKLEGAWVAHQKGDLAAEGRMLGAAVHALEDSFSSAHIFRDITDPTDAHAPIVAINSFDWLRPHHQTHESTFDKAAVDSSGRLERPSEQAASKAIAEMLGTYFSHASDNVLGAAKAFTETVSSFFIDSGSIHQFTDSRDPEFQAMRDARFEKEMCAPWETKMDPHHAGSPAHSGFDPGLHTHGHSDFPGIGNSSGDANNSTLQGHEIYGAPSLDPAASLADTHGQSQGIGHSGHEPNFTTFDGQHVYVAQLDAAGFVGHDQSHSSDHWGTDAGHTTTHGQDVHTMPLDATDHSSVGTDSLHSTDHHGQEPNYSTPEGQQVNVASTDAAGSIAHDQSHSTGHWGTDADHTTAQSQVTYAAPLDATDHSSIGTGSVHSTDHSGQEPNYSTSEGQQVYMAPLDATAHPTDHPPVDAGMAAMGGPGSGPDHVPGHDASPAHDAGHDAASAADSSHI